MSETNTPGERTADFFGETKTLVEEYLDDRLLLLKIRFTSKLATLLGFLSGGLVLCSMAFFVLLFLSIAVGFWLSEILGSFFYGFGVLTLIYLLLFVIFLVFRKKIFHNLVTNAVVQAIFDDQNEDDERESTSER